MIVIILGGSFIYAVVGLGTFLYHVNHFSDNYEDSVNLYAALSWPIWWFNHLMEKLSEKF